MKVALYAGSFNPFHKGHLNIVEKAEDIFDKVIIARGQNPAKKDNYYELPSEVLKREVVHYSGLLTDCIKSLPYDDVVLVRGLRNATDLQAELIQYRFLKELMPQLKVVSIFCDKEFEHISSSAIRQLELYGEGDKYLVK